MEDRETTVRSCRSPKVVVVGAGMAGLAAASRLKSAKNAEFEVIVVEGSHRIGGRICTSELAGERVELGATWIHGIEGSPLYEIAELSGALKGDMPWECMDGFPARPVVKAEGGYVVDQAIVEQVKRLYKKLFSEAQEQFEHRLQHLSTEDRNALAGKVMKSLGAFLKMGLNGFLSEQLKALENGGMASYNSNGLTPKQANGVIHSSGWTLPSLIKGVFSIHENSERAETGADSLYNLDLPNFGEYWEFPGEHISIAKGFSSVIHSLTSGLPPGTIKFGKMVESIRWNDQSNSHPGLPVQLHCQDGSIIAADHVIITVSLGVLKAFTTSSGAPSDTWKEATLGACFSHSCQAQAFQAKNEENLIRDKLIASHAQLFQPPLPPWKVQAIDRLGFGVVDKVFTLMEPVQGDSHNHMQFIYKSIAQENSAIPSWMRKTPALYPIHSKSHVLLAWFVGKEALEMEALSDEEIGRGIANTLSEFGFCKKSSKLSCHLDAPCKKLTAENGDDQDHSAGALPKRTSNSNGNYPHCSIKHSKWGTDPLFLGSYSYIANGSSGADIDALAEPLPRPSPVKKSELATPALQLLFAGEATHRYHYSTTHGAYFSGVREADRLLKHYGWLI